ncbi:MAG: ABC-F family ATP-binding cassette domain-containing protein [Muribaculaceae bacterium]|nr:ABC-F family ATP-binding cassette domain-containing protein [Muribaculaceae bacterium]
MSTISYLQIENLTKSFGYRMIFDSVSLGISQGDKIGLIAKNGTGKTTLLRIIAGLDSPDSGTVTLRNDLRVSIVEQHPCFQTGHTVLEACLHIPDVPHARATLQYEKALLSNNQQRILEASAEMDSLGAWDFLDRLRQMLHRLDITNLDSPVETLSGGQLKRIAIANALLSDPQLLILDEPTNHLDVESIEWLQQFLSRQNLTLLLVTHDRYFLDEVCNRIIELDDQRIYSYPGNYTDFVRRRKERIEALAAANDRRRNTLRREQEWMSRQPQARAGKARYRIDAFHELKRAVDSYRPDNATIELSSAKASYIGSKIFEAKHISKRWGDKVILSDFSYTFARYEKLGIIGPNGVGKSTLIKMLQGLVKPDSGEWDVGTTVRFGYYSQTGIDFDPQKKVIDAVTDLAEEIQLAQGVNLSPMQWLNRFLFTPADQQKYIHTLSGGERSRLYLATILMQQPNFLILDEPTNDLDILTLGILEEYLRDFKGCLIVVSHDRFFLDNIVDHLWIMEGNGDIRDFPGTYSEYRKWRTERDAHLKSLAESKEKNAPARTRQVAERPRKMSFKERQEFEALTSEIDTLTAERNTLDERFSSGETLTDAAELAKRYNELNTLLDEKELRWLELSELDS